MLLRFSGICTSLLLLLFSANIFANPVGKSDNAKEFDVNEIDRSNHLIGQEILLCCESLEYLTAENLRLSQCMVKKIFCSLLSRYMR